MDILFENEYYFNSIFPRYLTRTPELLAMHITKYKSREGYSHRDLLRLSHPQASQHHAKKDSEHTTLVYDQIFHFACKGSHSLAILL
jgi:hypothetical protein